VIESGFHRNVVDVIKNNSLAEKNAKDAKKNVLTILFLFCVFCVLHGKSFLLRTAAVIGWAD